MCFINRNKIIKSNNSNSQGPGSNNFDADFNFYNEEFPYYKINQVISSKF